MNASLRERLLKAPRRTIAVAESLTSGRVQALIGAASGASDYFVGGITAYSLDQKVKHLGVDRAAARKVNSVSAEVAEQMARGACLLFGSDLAVATTGYAEPAPAYDVVTPFAWWALAERRKGKFIAIRSGRVECMKANRTDAQQIVAEAVMAELVAYLGLPAGRQF
jgi:nicotinamide-nucleotide amidase